MMFLHQPSTQLKAALFARLRTLVEADDSSSEDEEAEEVDAKLKKKQRNKKKHAYVLQQYITPALLEGRKFHIRALLLLVGSKGAFLFSQARCSVDSWLWLCVVCLHAHLLLVSPSEFCLP